MEGGVFNYLSIENQGLSKFASHSCCHLLLLQKKIMNFTSKEVEAVILSSAITSYVFDADAVISIVFTTNLGNVRIKNIGQNTILRKEMYQPEILERYVGKILMDINIKHKIEATAVCNKNPWNMDMSFKL